MIVLWIMVPVLVVVLFILGALLKGILAEAKSITSTATAIAGVAAAGSRDLDAVIALVTTQNYISQTVAGLANYGGSLDVALPDA
jgi:hypothetical protein